MNTLDAIKNKDGTVNVLNKGTVVYTTDKLNKRNKYCMYNCAKYKLNWLN
jgi:predicted lipoprotein with Yx(FWY)xxD motif